MKSIKKILFIMAALAATLAFVSCSNGDDDGDDGVVAVYKGDVGGVVTLKITCFDNGKWEMIEDASGAEPEMWGTYEGDPSKDGDVTITVTGEHGKSDYKANSVTKTIKNGSFEFDGVTFERQ